MAHVGPLQPGHDLDHYRLERMVARSGMSSVFRGVDLRNGRQVAIKIPHPEMECDPVFFDRFRREQEIGQKMDHPGVMKVLADGDHRRIYMVMEWIEGRLLRQVLAADTKLPLDRSVTIALRICDALDYIHTHGVVHRDLKPENIMIDAEDRTKLIDFGIANIAGARRLTFGKFSKLMGTPEYISPEQVRGKRGNARSDIYSLGVMLYEMLTGRTPFQGSNPFAVMNDRVSHNPIPPREVAPEISLQLQEIVYRALERDPRNRYASARELAWDLEHQNQIEVIDRTELREWDWRRQPLSKKVLFYSMVALIPVGIFGLLLYVAQLG